MPEVDRLYAWLTGAPAPAADRALGEALEHADPPYFQRIAECLVARRNETALAGLIGCYDRLDARVQERVTQDPALLLGAIGLAMRAESVPARLNALAVYRACPTPRLSHILPGAFRDASAAVRNRAAEVLRIVAERVHAAWERRSGLSDPRAVRQIEDETAKFVETLGEVLRTLDVHLRVEILEPCLWFWPLLREELIAALQRPRSRAAHVILDHLQRWATPRAAAFLLWALTQPEFRRRAHRILAAWDEPEHVSALLASSAALEDEAIRRAVGSIKNPAWFHKMDASLSAVPAHLRPHAPRWVNAGGFTDDARGMYLEEWVRSSDARLAEAVVRGLDPAGREFDRNLLRSVAGGSSPAARLAGARLLEAGVLAAADARLADGVSADASDELIPAGVFGSVGAVNVDFGLIWQLCRQRPLEESWPLVELLIEFVDVWGHRLASCAASSDARDRILALQIARAAGMTERLRGVLGALVKDDVAAVRRLALELAGPAGRAPTSAAPAVEASAGRALWYAGDAASAAARAELRQVVQRLGRQSDLRSPAAAEALERLRQCLRRAYPRPGEPTMAGGPQARSI